MSWFQDAISNFIDSILAMFNLIWNWITSIFSVFSFIPNIINNISTGLGYIPSFLLPFAGICLAITCIYLVIGRDHG